MKKLSLFLSLILTMMVGACSYDDSGLWDAVEDLDNRVSNLEEAVDKLSNQTSTLQKLLDNKLFIVSAEPVEEGIKLQLMTASGEMTTMIVRNGADGKDGADGQSAAPPSIGVQMDDNGNYFWTIDGKPLLDSNGNMVPVNGTNGKDGKTPTFKIEDGKWWVSFDNGINWTGPYGQATGADGDAFFSAVYLSENGNTVRFELVDGTSVTIPLYKEFNLAFEVDNVLIVSGSTAEIPFTVTGATPSTIVEAFGKNGWEADILQDVPSAGILKVTAPANQTGSGRIVVIANDGAQATIMRTLTVVAGEVIVGTSSVEIPQAGGNVSVEVTTNLEFSAEVDPSAQEWLSVGGSRAEMRTESISLVAAANDTPYERIGLVYLKNDGAVVETITIVQSAVSYNRDNIVIVVDPALVSGGRITIPTLNLASGSGSVTVDWGDGSEPETATSNWNSPSHTYANTSQTYIVEISGKVSEFQVTQNGITDIVQWGTNPYRTIQAASATLVRVAAPEPESKASVNTVRFTGATKLASIDPDFFKGMTNLTDLNSAFRNCSSLKSLPDGMFDDCKKVTNIYQLFDGCTSLERVPSMQYLASENTTGTLQVAYMFRNCESLREIPENMFSEVTKAKFYNFTQMFSGCKSLVTIPDDFFAGAHVEKNNYFMAQIFYNCVNLEHLDLDQFFNDTALLGSSWTNSFNGCAKLKGTITPYKLTVNGTVYEIYPWERTDYINHADAAVKAAAQAVFGARTNSGAGCFTGCTSLDGYATLIPTSWGGLFDGIVAPPTVTVTGSLAPNQTYYAINFTVRSKNATSMKYLLGSKADYDQLLPGYNNDVTKMVGALGTELDTPYVNAANSSSLSLPFSDADPSTEYILTVAAFNSLGQATGQASVTTSAVPRGSDAYESYIGTWLVTSDDSTTEVEGGTGPISFQITIEPYRVDESYMVKGWGTTIFRDHPANAMRFMFENGSMNAYAGYAGPKSMWNTIASRYYGYTHESYGYQMCDIGMFAYGATIPDGNFSVLLATPSNPILTSRIDGDRIDMTGGRGGEIGAYGISSIAGMDIFLNTGGYGWSFTRRPAETVLSDYLTTIDGVEYGKYAIGPYTLTRVTGASRASAKQTPKGFIKLDL